MEENVKKKYRFICMGITESLYCIPEANTVNQLYFNKNSKKKNHKQKKVFYFHVLWDM